MVQSNAGAAQLIVSSLVLVLACFASRAIAAIEPQSDCNQSFIQATAPFDTRISSAAETSLEASGSQTASSYCQVLAQIVSDRTQTNVINFELDLPDPGLWNGRFQFRGNGGWAGDLESVVSAPDYVTQLRLGYAMAATDTGHIAVLGSDGQPRLGLAQWAVVSCKSATGNCVPNIPAVKDFAYRAVHKTTVAAKAILSRYYSAAKGLNEVTYHSYFYGCSTGGRQALVEAEKYPADFDGIVAGDPVIGNPFVGFNWNAQNFLQQSAYLDPAAISLVNQQVVEQCGDPNGPAQGLVLDPGNCDFNPASLLCATNQTTQCLTTPQVTAFDAIYRGAHNASGSLLYPGYSKSDPGDDAPPPLTDLSWEDWMTGCADRGVCVPPDFGLAEPWGAYYPARGTAPSQWLYQDQFLKYMVYHNENYDSRTFGVFDVKAQVFTDVKALSRATRVIKRWGGDGANPDLRRFASLGHKLIITHGWSDPAISPFESVTYFNKVKKILGAATGESVRLFMAPGMHHCEGGPGPNVFDALTPTTQWVEQGLPPDGDSATGVMVASHYIDNARGNYPTPDRTMPLCSYPELPTYVGPPGGVNGAYFTANNWICR